ncbi:hypothetical protein SPRG_22343 [Saprolegnia parasitica CBS 223.65]|uniref:Zinc finger PHD-type domain-containing protein n=1 Tax=Saprolegnia parasitica (strain CBS 223.65) TaxID=695850 RepID=A0A067C0N6_SAPPC|nr:hypothetical protein SPRG_22343 [Saprolegnia parasitica CBS 223.65]KDO20116.1 hypothetical protein SPRG_22343 [Saprolegnia parasitica CBS 223.65]|eukprot:XP_012209181.1 hypothetical protein SPRG_22343 [Saprolegnia parasitica CBS 223.65]
MQCVWHSTDLLREIMSFQLGVPYDTHTLLHALRSLVWDNADVLATLPPALAPIHDIFPAWFKVHGARGLKRMPFSIALELFYYGLYYGHLDVIRHFCDKLPVDYVEWHLVIMSGNVVAVKFLLDAYPDGCFFQTIERAIEHGHLGVVRALRAHGVPWPATAWKVASQHGRADIASYLDAYKCPWHEHWRGEVAEAAAEGGHVDVLRPVRKRGLILKLTKPLDHAMLILCDNCDGEFSMPHIGLDAVPRGAWFCRHCRPQITGALPEPLTDDDDDDDDGDNASLGSKKRHVGSESPKKKRRV